MSVKSLNNKEFDLFGTTWKVKLVDKIDTEEEGFCFGQTQYDIYTIYIVNKDSHGNKLDSKEIELTFLHELFHAILFTGQYNTYSNDEPAVEWMARCINSLKNQKML